MKKTVKMPSSEEADLIRVKYELRMGRKCSMQRTGDCHGRTDYRYLKVVMRLF